MLSHTLLRDDGVLLLSPKEPFEASDFQELASEVDPYIAEHGNLQGLMVVAEKVPGWRNFGGFKSHMRFVRNHFAKIKKIAAVTDNKWLTFFPGMLVRMFSSKVRTSAMRIGKRRLPGYGRGSPPVQTTSFGHRLNWAMEGKPV